MTDKPFSVAFDPAAPVGERFDAGSEMQATYAPTASELIPRGDLMPIIDMIRGDMAETALVKASGSIAGYPGEHGPKKIDGRGMTSVYLDNLQIYLSGNTYEKPAPLGFEGLRQMVDQTPILSAIVMTRIRQVSRFCQPSEDGGPGYEIRHVDRKHELTPEEEVSTRLLSRFVANCGWEFNPRRRKAMKRESFTRFMSKHLRDSLTMDAAPVETEMKRDRSLGIDGFYAVDGSTIRLCTDEGYDGDDSIYALQMIQGRICTAYTQDQLIYEVRNPRSDVRLAGYGLGEPELLIRVVTGILNAMSYNIAGFDNNAIPKGLLHLSGDYDQADLAAFKRYWNAQVKGINNAWSLPVMISKDQESKANFESFGVEHNEMHFAKWMTFLCSICCAIYGMSPDEINFESFAAQKSSLSGSDTEEKLTNAKDSGLHPDMAHLEAEMSDFIISEFDDKFCFRWVGTTPEDADRVWEGKKLTYTVDELRAEQGLQPHPDAKVGALPLNPTLIGPAMQLNQPPKPGGDFGGQAQEPGQDFGNADDGDDPAGDDQAGGEANGTGDPSQAGPDGVPTGPAPAGPPAAAGAPGGDYGGPGKGDFGKAMGLTIYAVG